MRLKLDSVTHARSSTQDGLRDKLALRFQLLDPLDEEQAYSLVGQTLEAQFEPEQESLPGMAPTSNGRVDVPSAGRRRRGTKANVTD